MVASHSTAYFSSLKGNLSSNIYEMKLKEWKVFSSPLSHILKKILDFNTFICRIYPSLMLRCKVMFECWALEEKKLTICFILCVSLYAVADCWRWMVRGSNLVKVRPNGRTYNRFFSLDEDLSCIRWLPTSKKASKATGMCDTTNLFCYFFSSKILQYPHVPGFSSNM